MGLFLLALPISAQPNRMNDRSHELAKSYLSQGLYKKAARIYKKLLEDSFSEPIYREYIDLLLRMQRYEQAEKYIEEALEHRKDYLLLWADLFYVWKEMNKASKGKQVLLQLIDREKQQAQRLRMLAYYLSDRLLYEESLLVYEQARKFAKDPSSYSISIARLYSAMGDERKAIHEYLDYLRHHPHQFKYIKGMMTAFYKQKEDWNRWKELLSIHRQRYPDSKGLLDLSVWLFSELQMYEEALQEAVSADLRKPLGAKYFMDLGKRAFQRKSYQVAQSTFDYVATHYAKHIEARGARYYALEVQEKLYLGRSPLVRAELWSLVSAYKRFIEESRHDVQEIEAQHRLAWLYSQHLESTDSSILVLKRATRSARSYPRLLATSKLALGDTYLLSGRPWEAILTYIQVERESQETDLIERAQLSRSRVNYYQGAFDLAQAQLAVLRQASSKYVANDALLLSELISWYTSSDHDSTHQVLRNLASAELALKAGRINRADSVLTQLLLEPHPAEAIYYTRYLLAQVRRKKGAFASALELLVENLASPAHLLSDRSLILRAEILEEDMSSIDEAVEAYRDLINRMPESIYSSRVRRHLQELAKNSFVSP